MDFDADTCVSFANLGLNHNQAEKVYIQVYTEDAKNLPRDDENSVLDIEKYKNNFTWSVLIFISDSLRVWMNTNYYYDMNLQKNKLIPYNQKVTSALLPIIGRALSSNISASEMKVLAVCMRKAMQMYPDYNNSSMRKGLKKLKLRTIQFFYLLHLIEIGYDVCEYLQLQNTCYGISVIKIQEDEVSKLCIEMKNHPSLKITNNHICNICGYRFGRDKYRQCLYLYHHLINEIWKMR